MRSTDGQTRCRPAAARGGDATLAFDNGAVQSAEEVIYTCMFRNLMAGPRTIRRPARKETNTAPISTVNDNSMTFACQNNLRDGDDPGNGVGA
jgi:hypothetical protein